MLLIIPLLNRPLAYKVSPRGIKIFSTIYLFDRYIITRHGKPEAILLSEEDYESLIETIDILSDPKLMKDIKKAKEEFKKGKGIPWEKVKQKLGHV